MIDALDLPSHLADPARARARARRHGAADVRRRRAATARRRLVCGLAIVLLVVAAVLLAMQPPGTVVAFNGSFVLDGYARFLKILALIGSAVTILLSIEFLSAPGQQKFEYPVLILLSTAGMLVLISAGRPDRALSRPRADEPRALRHRRDRPRQCPLDRGGAQIFRARRALVRHAALRLLADLRLHRHGELCRHRQGGRRGRASG